MKNYQIEKVSKSREYQVEQISKTIGKTPLVYIEKSHDCNICAKLEFLNLGGSIKSRTAYWMIKNALEDGVIDKNTVLIEASSGNQGIGISMIGAIMGFDVKIIMPENMSQERRQFISAYGAEIILTPAGENIKEAIDNAIDKANELIEKNNNYYWLNQFANKYNTEVHKLFTAKEIIDELEKPVDFFISGIGTGGTITGIGTELKKIYPDCNVVAVEPERAAILQGGKMGHHIQQGIGDGLIPEILDINIIDEMIKISDEEARINANRLAKKGFFAGFTSGSNISAAYKIAEKYPGSHIVTILPDGGGRYITENIISPVN